LLGVILNRAEMFVQNFNAIKKIGRGYKPRPARELWIHQAEGMVI
jgi:hypothetical protein